MKAQQNQFRSQNGSVYSANSKQNDVVKYDTLKREIEDHRHNNQVGILHASFVHANKHLSKA